MKGRQFDGEYKFYNKAGQVIVHHYFRNGQYHGEYKRYYSNGEIREHCFYANGEDITNKVVNIVHNFLNITKEEYVVLKLSFGINQL